ncbi:glutathione S-transferase family protein [Fulvimonas yonginensis]|uniref:Glutathione S-transferase family protein n=1 Tax=Fulvimonas yonginensis TaxID=1495200 RepID=A0ABU8J8S7_9GAMM
MPHAILYSGTRNASSWAMRAWLALREAEFPFEERMVDIRRPQRFANLARIARFSPSATVPALVLGETVVFDSLAIMELANDHAGGRLLPADPERRAVARSIVAWQHAGLSRICWRISFESAFYPWKRPLTPDEQGEVARLCAALEPVLAASGGPYLFGAVSLADFALAPAAVRLLRHRPDLAAWPATAAWMRELIASRWVAEWLRQADTLPHIWFDDYLPEAAAPPPWRVDPHPAQGSQSP